MGQSDDTPETAAKTAVSPLNGARIPLGNHPGNTGGKKGRSGAKPSAIRAACALAFKQRIKVLKEIADNADEAARTRAMAVDLLGKYGGIQKVEHTGSDDAPLIPPGRLDPADVRNRIAALVGRN